MVSVLAHELKPWIVFTTEGKRFKVRVVGVYWICERKHGMCMPCPEFEPSSYPLRFGQINFIRFDGHKNILLITCSFFPQNFRRLFVSMVYVVLHSAKIYQAFIRYDLDGLDHLLNHTKSKLISWFMACIRGIIS